MEKEKQLFDRRLTFPTSTIDTIDGIGSGSPLAPRWKVVEWGVGNTTLPKAVFKTMGEGQALYRLKDNDYWWYLDDIAKVVSGEGSILFTNRWMITTSEGLERIKALFRILGVDLWLSICENPEWTKRPNERNLLATLETRKIIEMRQSGLRSENTIENTVA